MHAIARPLATLPDPDPAAQDASRALIARIRSAIAEAGGALDFAAFMELALYAPRLGYYTGGARKFGAAGDFTTAPELTPLFGRTLAHTLAPVVAGRELLELGAGTGRLACDLLDALAAADALPERYSILELSGELRARQQAALASRHPALESRIRWLDRLPDALRGAIVANEVLDVVPVHLVQWAECAQDTGGGFSPATVPAAVPAAVPATTAATTATATATAGISAGISERCVACGDEGADGSGAPFRWVERPLESPALLDAAARIPVEAAARPYLSEVAPAVNALVGSLIERLQQGIAVFIDYGFGRAEYYHPQRRHGTLMCHYRQHAHTDPFFLPGLQDITAHVDFTAVAEAALAAGGRLAGYTTQANFLLDAGIADLLAQTPADQPGRYLPQVAAVQRLLSPAEMGELFKVMVIARDCELVLPGLGARDLSRML